MSLFLTSAQLVIACSAESVIRDSTQGRALNDGLYEQGPCIANADPVKTLAIIPSDVL